MKLDWKSIASDVAPTIASVVSGGNPVVMALTSTIVKKALGLPAEASEENITTAMQTDPDALVKIKQAETDLQAKLAEYGIQDIANARAMQDKTKSEIPKLLTILNYILFIIVVGIISWLLYLGKLVNMNAMEASIFTLLIREIFALVNDNSRFYFGSSIGSREKDDTIQNMSR